MTSCENTLNTLRYANRWENVDLWIGHWLSSTLMSGPFKPLPLLGGLLGLLARVKFLALLNVLFLALTLVSLLFVSRSVFFACSLCCRVEWRSLGLVRRTSPSPRAVRGVALTTRPPIPLSTMTLLLPLPAGQAPPQHNWLLILTPQSVHVLPASMSLLTVWNLCFFILLLHELCHPPSHALPRAFCSACV